MRLGNLPRRIWFSTTANWSCRTSSSWLETVNNNSKRCQRLMGVPSSRLAAGVGEVRKEIIGLGTRGRQVWKP
jgi:hypothetical protein